MQPLATSLIRCRIYLSCFSGRRGSCANLQTLTHQDRNKPWCLTWRGKEEKVEITNAGVRRVGRGGKKARLVLMHVRAASAAAQGQKAAESVWGRNKGSLLHGSVPQLGGTLSHSYEVWPPQTIKSPFTLSDFFWNHGGEWITRRQPGIWQEWHLSHAWNTWPAGEILICPLWNQTYIIPSSRHVI